jgi:hypothetical protein
MYMYIYIRVYILQRLTKLALKHAQKQKKAKSVMGDDSEEEKQEVDYECLQLEEPRPPTSVTL